MVKATRAMTAKKNPNHIRFGALASLVVFAVLGSYDQGRQFLLVRRQAAFTDYVKQVILNDHPCPLRHTSQLSAPTVIIDKTAIRAQSKAPLDHLKQFTIAGYEKYMMDDPGREHYTLWHYLTKTYHNHNDCRHVVDIGTRFVASALALGATGVPVKTFDIPTSTERRAAFRGKSEHEWQTQLQNSTTVRIDIEFHNLDLLQVSDQEFRDYMSTWLIVVDTFHNPYSVPFEREWLSRLVTMEPKFEGIVMLDDIHFNDEMKQWWKEINDNASRLDYKVYDLTSVGHVSGTGLVDFSGKVVIQE